MTSIGHNKAPLDDADEIAKRIDGEFADLLDAVMAHDLKRHQLPKELNADEDCAKVSEWVAGLKKIAADAEKKRKEKGAAYLAAQRAINSWFEDLTADLLKASEALTKSVGRYNLAKAERERAERLERERQQREIAEAARREEERKRREAEDAEAEAAAAAARIRQAKDAEAREAAAKQMREASAQADQLREAAEADAETAAKAERKADNNARAAEGNSAKLSRIASAGATSSVTDKWTYTVLDWDKLRASLGPLGPWLDNAVIETSIARAVRQQSAGGATPTLALPGVDVHTEVKTNIRAARA